MSQMNEPLLTVFKNMSQRMTGMHKDEILSRYDLGRSFSTVVTDTRKYGENAAKLLAQALSVSETWVYQHRQLYNQWKDNYNDLKRLATATGSNGMSLTYSHMVYINTINSATKRLEVAEKCLARCLTVEDTKAWIYEEFGKKSNNQGQINPKNPKAGLAVFSKAIKKLEQSHAKIQTSIFQRIAKTPDVFANDKTIESIAELIAQAEAAQELLRVDVDQLQSTLDTLTELRATELESDASELDEPDEYDLPAPKPHAVAKPMRRAVAGAVANMAPPKRDLAAEIAKTRAVWQPLKKRMEHALGLGSV